MGGLIRIPVDDILATTKTLKEEGVERVRILSVHRTVLTYALPDLATVLLIHRILVMGAEEGQPVTVRG